MKLPLLFTFRSLLAGLLGLAGALVAARAQSSLPHAQVGQSYSFQVTTTPAAPAGTVYSATGLPSGISIGSSSGLVSGTPTTAGLSTGEISLTANLATNAFSYVLVVDPATGTPAITSGVAATATVGTAFTYTATASNSPNSFNLGALPAGLSANATNGEITGTPTLAGTYQVTLSANNATGGGAATTLTITVNPAGAVPAVTSSATAPAMPNAAFSFTITASNSPASFAASGLPLGLTLNPTSGVISGTPTITGVTTVALSATNNFGASASSNLTITIGALASVTSAIAANAGVGAAFSYTITGSNTPTSYNVSGLPPGLSVDTQSGVISGPPTATGTATVSLSANNAVGTGPVATLTITIGNVPVITSVAAASATVGSPFTYTIVATNAPTSYAASGLPAGLSLAAGTAMISGTPTSPGTVSVALTATNASGPSASLSLVLSIAAASSGGGGGGGGGGVTPVSTAPTFVTQPASQSGAEGSSVTFTANASNALTYQWYKDRVGLAGASSTSLTLANLKTSDAGSYTVTATGFGGVVTSNPATLTVVALVVAPVVTAAPVSQSLLMGANATLSVTASGGAPLSYQWRKDGVALAGATGATLTLNAVGLSAAGSYTVVLTNSAGSTTSAAAVFGVTARPVPGTYFGSFGGNGGTFALYVRSDRTGVFLGYARSTRVAFVSRDVAIDAGGHFSVTTGGAAAAFAPLPGTAAAAPTYVIDGTIGADGAVSGTVSGLNLTLSAPAAVSGATAAVAGFYQAGAALSAAVSYAIVGAAGDAYVVTVNGTSADAGRGTVDTNGRVAVTTENQVAVAGAIQTATIALTATSAGGAPVAFVGANNELRTQTEKLINLSTRSQAGTGANVLIAGFVLTGSAPKSVLVRGIGPSLAQFGVAGALAAARLEVYRGSTSLAVGNAWGAAANSAAIAAAAANVGAFPLAATSHDAALLLTLDPGAYTVMVSGQNNVTGVSLVEVYDATVGPIPAAQRLINISSRAAVAAADATLIGGFVITGTVPKRVLIRGAGPSLAQFGLTGLLARPQLLLFKGSQTLAQNAGWSASADAAAIAAAAAQVGAFAFPTDGADAALLVNLEPGAYTAQVVGVGGATGIALVEIYEVP